MKKVDLDDPTALEKSSLEGLTGKLTMHFRPNSPFNFKIVKDVPEQIVEYETLLPGTRAIWYWHFGPGRDSETTDLNMGVRMDGWATWLYKWALGRDVEKAFVICTGNLKRLIETGSVEPVANAEP